MKPDQFFTFTYVAASERTAEECPAADSRAEESDHRNCGVVGSSVRSPISPDLNHLNATPSEFLSVTKRISPPPPVFYFVVRDEQADQLFPPPPPFPYRRHRCIVPPSSLHMRLSAVIVRSCRISWFLWNRGGCRKSSPLFLHIWHVGLAITE